MKPMFFFRGSFSFALTLFTAIGVSATKKLVITGSSTVAPLVSEIAKSFEKKHPQTRVEVQTGGSTRGLIEARQGVNDIGMISRNLKNNEKNLEQYTLAKDGIAIIVNAQNPIESLSKAQIKGIFQKSTNSWKDVGGLPSPITVIHKAEGRSTLELFLNFYQLKNNQIKPDIIIGDNEQGIKSIANNPNAIGYVSIGTAEYHIKQKVPIKMLPMNGVRASTESLRQGIYPLSRNLNLIIQRSPSKRSEKRSENISENLKDHFIQFATSKDVHALIQQQGFIPYKKN